MGHGLKLLDSGQQANQQKKQQLEKYDRLVLIGIKQLLVGCVAACRSWMVIDLQNSCGEKNNSLDCFSFILVATRRIHLGSAN